MKFPVTSKEVTRAVYVTKRLLTGNYKLDTVNCSTDNYGE